MVKRKQAQASAAAAAPSKSPMEESADALAGVEGALTGGKRGAPAKPSAKAAPGGSEGGKERPRSNSIERLSEVAGTLLKEDLPANPREVAGMAAAGMTYVPDPMAAAAAAAAAAGTAAAAAPTGFRKKGSAKAAAAASSAAARAASHPHSGSESDGKPKKTQITYNPDIPMTKEQLTAWRREMRRVRNRESAAASRRKVRDRIEELEEEVAVWKRRYEGVMAKLGQSEGGSAKKKSRKNGDDSEAM